MVCFFVDARVFWRYAIPIDPSLRIADQKKLKGPSAPDLSTKLILLHGLIDQ